MNEPTDAPENTDRDSVESTAFFAVLNARLEHAEKRYIQEQQEGDAVSVASTRAYFLGWRDARELVRHHLSANTKAGQRVASGQSTSKEGGSNG